MFYLFCSTFPLIMLSLVISIYVFSNISVMEGLVSDVCVTCATAGQLTQLRSSTRRFPTLCVVFIVI